ncbi:hypothetical protein L228DRAFT_282815 [Xylona heveae TC161]|uniref:RRM domain-containing protein n=1 Tax=Xylona heveae (strain CBS 132557 / TC161) TaxID=1328760 RepID=A0A165GXJ2_XYLHT|nr:hypothetical protein L228DRAFT_282815 [Xylona heveae TC161]KZF22728.1 hypothetical protein L228DRAFT_282815 [Xylona heveae TC161]
MTDSVTIDKGYFETLLRRAELHENVIHNHGITQENGSVILLWREYQNLIRQSQEYAALRQTLLLGGVDLETLELLVHQTPTALNVPKPAADVERPIPSKQPDPGSNPRATNAARAPNTLMQGKNSGSGSKSFDFQAGQLAIDKKNDLQAPPERGFPNTSVKANERNDVDTGSDSALKDERRTLRITGLPKHTTHKKLIEAIRGGALIDIFLKKDGSANVSFVKSDAARNFYEYSSRHGIFILGTKVDVCWNDRQFVINPSMAYKLSKGASRNLILRNVHAGITAAKLRQDLDHIHNLVVVDITSRAGNMIICLNSISVSVFARTCILSRAIYKGMFLDWYPDECAAPLVTLGAEKVGKIERPGIRKEPSKNRYMVLNTEGTEDGSEDGSDKGERLSSALSTIGPGISWAE